jgi:uncharacterized protein (TIGR03435 family)
MRPCLCLLLPALLNAQLAFEAASIKPAPQQPMNSISVSKDTEKGRLTYQNVSLNDLIAEAYRLLERQITGPDWLKSQRFDIVATYPAGAGEKDVPEMLKALLADRFGLKVHEESKEMSLYAILPAKTGPKMKKADEGGNFSTNSGKTLVHITATASMAGLANSLSGLVDRPVVDQSGLEGPWVIDLQFVRDASSASTDDVSAPSVFTAMQEQLGLRLNPTKGPMKFLVIDHAERTPTEN